MNFLRVVTIVSLLLVLPAINGFAGYGYIFGGTFYAMGSMGSKQAKGDSRVVTEMGEAGKKVMKPKDDLSALSLIFETRFGFFGLALISLAWLQFIAGVVLCVKEEAGPILAGCLALVALGSLAAEIVGSIYTWFGVTNAFGMIAAILMGVVVYFMYQKKCASSSVKPLTS